MIKLLDFVLKDGENVTGRVAGLELYCEGMNKKIALGLFLICFHCSIEDGLEVGRGCRSGWSLRHRKRNAGKLVSDVRETGRPKGRPSGQRGTSVFVSSGRWGITERMTKTDAEQDLACVDQVI